MKRLLYFLSPMTANYKLLLVASLPALAVTAWGLHQLSIVSPVVWGGTLAVRLLVEYAFLGLCLSLLNALGLKNKWLLAVPLYLYYIATTADFVLLWYFKERFGAKYFNTLQGGDYDFMTDWRLLSYFTLLGVFCVTILKKWFKIQSRKQTLKSAGLYAAVLIGFTLVNPFAWMSAPNDFFARYLLPPSPVYTINRLLDKPIPAQIVTALPAEVAATARKYNVFTAQNTGIGKNYKRVILIATESLSAKYMHRFNPLIPPAAGRGYDELFDTYPSSTLKTVTLSTLYGLTVIFSSHPYAQLSFENGYPVSVVKELKKAGFRTVFLRGAHEDYMHENELFHQAGFESVRGWKFFEQEPAYAKYLTWWGLLDRKLFEYAVQYLQEHKNEKTFLTLLTVDTHVPLGRTDYLDQSYEEIEARFYDRPTMPRAFARAAQDVQLFVQNLREKNLLDEDTLILITADHPSFSNTPTNALFRPFQPVFDRIPLAIITQPAIDKPLVANTLASQLDVAPTILDLLNLPQPKGFFGHSLFEQQAARSVFDIKEDYAVVTTENGRQVFPLNSRRPSDKRLIDLMTTFWVE